MRQEVNWKFPEQENVLEVKRLLVKRMSEREECVKTKDCRLLLEMDGVRKGRAEYLERLLIGRENKEPEMTLVIIFWLLLIIINYY